MNQDDIIKKTGPQPNGKSLSVRKTVILYPPEIKLINRIMNEQNFTNISQVFRYILSRY